MEQIFAQVTAGCVLGKRDLTNGFFHLVLAEEARRCMGFAHPVTGQIGRWVVLPQGTSQSPALFCEVTNAACRIFNKHFEIAGLKACAFVWVDEFILMADTHAEMQRFLT